MMRLSGVLFAGVLCAGLSACGGGRAPTLSLSAASESFMGTWGSTTNPTPAMVSVTNTGSGALNFTATSDSPWLMVSPSSGTAPQTLQVSAVVGTLTASNNIGHVTVTAMGAQGSPAAVTVNFIVVPPTASNSPVWQQWGANPQHSGMLANVAGQSLTSKLADIVYDPFVDQEKAENAPQFNGEAVLTVHEQAPLTDGNDVYMAMKTGTYSSCNPVGNWVNGAACGPNTWNSMIWNEARFTWINGALTQIWEWPSDWKPEPNATNLPQGQPGLGGWEPVFHAVDANGFIYTPGAQGAIWKLNKADGSVASHITPSFSGANVTPANTFVSGPLTADAQGNLYYNVIALNPSNGSPWNQNAVSGDVAGAWLVKVTSTDTPSMASYATLLSNAPLGSSMNCPTTFGNLSPVPAYPWPPSPGTPTPVFQAPCGSQRPGVNIAPVVGADGTIYTASVAHFDSLVSYVVAVNPDLTPKWQASLQVLNDGCGVLVPYGPTTSVTSNYCTLGATMGVDPTTNAPGTGYIVDQASSSPTVLPDGSVLFAALSDYDYGRGHLFKFDSTGKFVAAYHWGWDTTPAVYPHGGTYSIILKDNGHAGGNYCSNPVPLCAPPPGPGPQTITQVNANMQIEWQFQNTTFDANHPDGYEWCSNMPAVDMNGNVYVNSEDGNIYELPQGNTGVFTIPTGKLFLNLAIGAAYTPLSIGGDGKLYTQNNGHLFAVGN